MNEVRNISLIRNKVVLTAKRKDVLHMKVIEILKDIFLGNGEEDDTAEVDEKFTFSDWVLGTATIVAAMAPLGAILFIFG